MLGSHASGHRAANGSTAPDDQAPSFAECAAEAARDLPRAEQLTTELFYLSRATPYFDTGDLAPGTSSRSASWSSGCKPARPSSTAASARSVRDQLRQHYREGQDPVGAFGLVVNAIVLWNTRYVHAATEPSMRQRLPRPKRRHATALAPRPRPHQPARTLPAQRFQPAHGPLRALRDTITQDVTATRTVTGGSRSTAVSTAIGPSRDETADQLVAGGGSAPTCPSIESMSRW